MRNVARTHVVQFENAAKRFEIELAPDEAAAVGAEVHLRPRHTEERFPGGPSSGAPQEPPLQSHRSGLLRAEPEVSHQTTRGTTEETVVEGSGLVYLKGGNGQKYWANL